MKRILLFVTIGMLCLVKNLPAQNVFDFNDPVITYDSGHFPTPPTGNVISKWGRSRNSAITWNTDKFKPYYVNGMGFRLRYPNNYNPADLTKKYPMIIYFHGGLEAGTDNEYQLNRGAELFEQKINAGEFNGFMLFPQVTSGYWDYFYYMKVNTILDSMQKYCNFDADRVISMGISNGGLASVFYAGNFPQRVSTVISSSPALISVTINEIPKFIHIPIWLATGEIDANPDTNEVKLFVKAFTDQGGNLRYDQFPNIGHSSWDPQWALPYLVPYWNETHKANPNIFFQRNKFSSEAGLSVRMGISPYFSQYQWQKDLVDIPGATSNEITATKFGSYRVRFKRTSSANWSEWSPKPAVLSQLTAPNPPTGLKIVTTGSKLVNLDWDNAPEFSGITGFNVYVNGVKTYTTSESAITVINLTPNTTYSFTVTAFDKDTNTSVPSAAVTATTTSSNAGLTYRYYTGDWFNLPNFNTLTPGKTGASPNADINVRPTGVDNYYGFVWEGYITIKTAGTYTFGTASDDGSNVYFNAAYSPSAVPVVNNDGLHGYGLVTGSTYIAAPGSYPIAVTYFQKTGAEGISVYWSGPGFAMERIPDLAFVETPIDMVVPSTPVNLKVVSVGSSFVNLDWDDATDNIGVAGYDVYVNGTKKYTTTTSAVSADNLTASTSFNFTVVAFDQAGNRSATSAAITGITSANASNGLAYRFYQGDWNVLPNFSTLSPVKSGNAANVDVTVRTPGVNEYYGFVWEGYITIKTPGTYTFSTVSDDGSKLYFNSLYSPSATALVSNDGLHGYNTASGTISIATAGSYPIAITYFNKAGVNAGISVFWSGPGFSQQVIPDAAFIAPVSDVTPPSTPVGLKSISAGRTFINLDWNDATDNVGVTGYDVYVNGNKKYTSAGSAVTADSLTAGTSYNFTVVAFDQAGNRSATSAPLTATTAVGASNGLAYRFYQGDWNVLPDFNTLSPVKTGNSANFDVSVRTSGVNEFYGFVWEGYITIKTPGTYTFSTVSDDGSKLYFNTLYSPTATALVSNDGLHGYNMASGTVSIPAAGSYPITVTYFNKAGVNAGISVFWSGPGFSQQVIPDSAFIQTAGGVPQAPVATTSLMEQVQAGSAVITKAYPNPVSDWLNVQVFNGSQNNNISIGMYDLNGKMVYNRNYAHAPYGDNNFKMNISGSRLAPGIYVVRLLVNGMPSQVFKVVKALK